MPILSVITRTKNRAILLKRVLDSLSKQSRKDFEWIIVNDGGEVDCVDQICADARERCLDVTVIHHEVSKGMEAASNAGISISTAKYILIHDDDDSLAPTFCEKTIEFLENKKHFKGVVTLSTRVDEKIIDDKVVTTAFSAFNHGLFNIQLTEMVAGNLYPPISFVFERSVYDQIGGFDESLPVLGDWMFNLRFLERADIGVIREPLAFYHHRPSCTGTMGNTIYDGISAHIEYDAVVRNMLMRESMQSGDSSLGHYIAACYNQKLFDRYMLSRQLKDCMQWAIVRCRVRLSEVKKRFKEMLIKK